MPQSATPFRIPANRWSAEEAASLTPEGLLLYRSNLLGSDLTVTNFGGGNTSAKLDAKDPLTGETVTALWVKGSGGDIGSMKLDGFSTLYLDKLLGLEKLYRGVAFEDEMVAYLPHCTFGLNPRAASIDTPLHAYLPFAHVDHVHPDAIIALAASTGGEAATREIFGGSVGWLPWKRPGFDLGLTLRDYVAANPGLRGVMLAGHGVICWGDDARACYDNTIDLIAKAAAHLNARLVKGPAFGGEAVPALAPESRAKIAARLAPRLRGLMVGERSKVGHFSDTPETLEFVGSKAFARLAAVGTSCPDHFLRTKIAPLALDPARIDDDAYLAAALVEYRNGYLAYYGRNAGPNDPKVRDPNPVVVLLPGVGQLTFAADKKPGLSLSIFGQYFNRNETWAEMAGPWVDYMSRNAFMLQQGRFFADVAYFSGEEAPLTGLYVDAEMTDAPHGYAFDFVNSELLLNSLEVKEGALVAKSGASYQLLYLGGSSRRMSLAVLRRVHGLVEAGLSVAGVRPEGSPALADDPVEYKRLADDLWPAGKTEAAFGKGRVFAVDHPDKALAAMGLARDFDAGAAKPDADVRFVHRRLDDGDSYFVNNRLARPETLEARFRVAGKVPELWRPETGKTEPLSYRIENGVTVVPLALLADDAVHVVFRKTAAAASLVVPAPKETRLSELSGPWKLTFEQGRGAPAGVTLDALSSWSDAADPGVKYFSGVGTYSRDLTVKASDLKGGRIVLDLGEVRDLAEVFVNGARVGQVWHAPYRLDVTDVLKAGRNALEIKVANPWVNRLIGDTQPGAKKVTFTVVPTYVPGAPLRPSGLLGPVTLTAVTP